MDGATSTTPPTSDAAPAAAAAAEGADDVLTESKENVTVKEETKKRKREEKEQRWRTSRMVEDYVNLVSDLMVPNVTFARYGFSAEKGEIPVERPSLLGALMNPCRRSCAFEKWNPREIAVFEGCMAHYGKDFRTIQRFVQTKNTKEIIEFYYLWKMSTHYSEWKRNFFPEFPSPYDPAAHNANGLAISSHNSSHNKR